MHFNSPIFLLFAACFYLAWPGLRDSPRRRWISLTAFSFLFYGWWDWRFLFLLILSGCIDYWAAIGIERNSGRRRLLLVLSIVANVAILAAFKYLTFLISNVNALLSALGAESLIPLVQVFPPAGISFYTFQSMSYTIDVYRGKVRATRDYFHFMAYLSLFPQLVAGPVVRATELLGQLEKPGRATPRQQWEGLRLLAHGYFKKVVLADNLAPAVDHATNAFWLVESTPYWWIVGLMVLFQIYLDFSGYSDIARGLAKWMGYEIPVNFDHPFLSTTLRGSWNRWNTTVTWWFRDYVYMPLRKLGGGFAVRLLHRYVTMILIGLWHGASGTFVVFGAVHAILLTVEHILDLPGKLGRSLPARAICSLWVLVQWILAGVFFRAPTLDHAFLVLPTMLDPTKWDLAPIGDLSRSLPFLGIALAWEAGVFLGLDIQRLERSRLFRACEPALIVAMIVACFYLRGPGSPFIYFQF